MASSGALQEDAKEPELQKLNRRRIYLHRLVGDDISAPRTKSSRRTSWRVVSRFLLYAFIAIFTIFKRSNVWDLSEVNVGIEMAIRGSYFSLVPERKHFQDIESIEDMKQWLMNSILKDLSQRSNYSQPLSLLSYNRVVSTNGICPTYAALTLTLRRVKTTQDYEWTTTERFRQLYPRAWVANSLNAGTYGGGIEATETMTHRSMNDVQWVHTSRCDQSCEGEDFKREGFNAQGGYVAVMTVSESGTFVSLNDNDAPVYNSTAEGICTGVRRSAGITLDEFVNSGFLDDQFGSLTIEFITYNANLQCMSRVYVAFEAAAAGLITYKDVRSESIKLDIYDGIMRYFEVAYLVFTGCYFFEFCYRAYKYHPAFLQNVWTYVNFISIVSSLTSLTLWYISMPDQQKFVQKADFEHPNLLRQRFTYVQWYLRAGALANLTICLRILKYLGDMSTRVKLLLRTLGMGAKNMSIYICYVGVVFSGFVCFAFTCFSMESRSFASPATSFTSCFGMLMGDITPIYGMHHSLTVPFFVVFMLFFYFISVQMFNAIFNYAYNVVSEQMEPELEQEQRERKRKEQQRLTVSKDFYQLVKENLATLTGRQKTEDNTGAPKDSALEADKKKAPLDNSDTKVTSHNREKRRKAPDGACRVMLFFTFATFYIWFLYINLNIVDCSALKVAIDSAVRGAQAELATNSEPVAGMKWDSIVSLPDVANWIYGSLGAVLFNNTSIESMESAQRLGIHRRGAVCIKNWNCLVAGPGLAPAESPALLRLTQRRQDPRPNFGCMSNRTPPEFCFSGGKVPSLHTSCASNQTGEDLCSTDYKVHSEVLVKERLPPRPIRPEDPFSRDEDRNLDYSPLELNSTPFCKSFADRGFLSRGGIVCLLDGDYGTFLDQMGVMRSNDFITIPSTTFVIDFATYNGNKNMLTYVILDFVVMPSGVVEKRERVFSMQLFDFDAFLDNWGRIVGRILPGILYMILVTKFALDLYWDLRAEIYRKRLHENSNWIVASIEFITLDVFNAMEATSIAISFVSAIMYIRWLVKEGQLASKLEGGQEGDYERLLDYCMDLASQARLYNRLSALNVLLIFIRPLKFVRESARMAQLYQTLWDAHTDILWFVIIFTITMFGFVMFAHVTFGPFFAACKTIPQTANYLFAHILGNFDFWPLYRADPIMAAVFFFPYLLLFYCVFINIFFAIIDRYFVAVEAPPFNMKRRLKPIFQRICRCIEWDEDYVMEQDPKKEQRKAGPPSRQSDIKALVREIDLNVSENDRAPGKSCRLLSDVCDTDERMGDVLHWSREEANRMFLDFQKLLQKKQTVKNDEVFIKTDVMKQIREQSKQMREEMDEAERLMRYATKVHEQMAMRDQETLAKYILILELKIRNRMKQRHELEREVRHLRSESDKMRFTHEELTQRSNTLRVRGGDRWAEEREASSEDSDGDSHASAAGAPAPEEPAGSEAPLQPAAAAEAVSAPRAQHRKGLSAAFSGLQR